MSGPAYIIVERRSLRPLARWWTCVCEVAQWEADLRNGIAVSASWLRKKTGFDATAAFPGFGRVLDNNRSPRVSELEEIRAQISAYENRRGLRRKEAA